MLQHYHNDYNTYYLQYINVYYINQFQTFTSQSGYQNKNHAENKEIRGIQLSIHTVRTATDILTYLPIEGMNIYKSWQNTLVVDNHTQEM